jgi:hypothetical protein
MDTTQSSRIATGPEGLPAKRPGSDAPRTIDALIARLRRRWRLRLMLSGLAQVLVLTTATVLAAAWLLNEFHFSASAVWTLRLLSLTVLAGTIYVACVKPLRRRVSDARVALYLEEREPSLGGLLASAVDTRRAPDHDVSPRLAARVAEQALEACRRLDYGDAAEAYNLRRAWLRLGLAMLATALLAAWPPQFLRFGAPALLMPWTGAADYSPYRIDLQPGDIEIPRGGDQLISARIPGYDGDDVLLFTSRDDGRSWQQASMSIGAEASIFEAFLFDLDRHLDYYVSGAGQQSPVHRISVAEIPAIEEIALRYHFPEYTLLAPQTLTGSGDINALRGTRVEVMIRPTIDIPGGELLLDDGRAIALGRSADDSWVGEIRVEADATYRVRLQRASGVSVDASPDYRIQVLDDRHPNVSILSPGRDTKVSMVEEALLRVSASDDQGIADLQLVMSVNGAAEEVIDLIPAAKNSASGREVEAEHVLFLEQLDLRPGDLISYYVKARDRAPENRDRTATSDMFFYQVRPFSTHYRNASQQGGGGGSQGGQQQQGHLSEQQKQFVVATFKMIRDRDSYSDEAWRDNLELLATAEARIRDRVEAILRRIGRRTIVRVDERYKVVLEELPQAVEAMLEVEKLLRESEVESALTDAQRALLHLQRADAVFREINVSMASNSGGSAGSNSSFNDLANLFELEMDKLRNQYDTVQRGQQQSPQQVIDETLERLRELARRQQREVERQLRQRDRSLDGGENARQQALADELEEMARQLERLTREQRNQRLQQSIAQMRQAAEAMRRAANASGGGGADAARRAQESLRQAERLLDQGRVQQFSEAVEQNLRRAELAERKQASIGEDVADIDEPPGQRLEKELDRLQQRKQALAEDLAELESEIGRLAGEARAEQPKAGEALKRALETARANRLQDRIERTRPMLQLGEKEHAIANENEIRQGIARVRKHLEEALAQVGEPGERGMQRSLEQLRSLARELRFMRERAAGGGEANTPDGGAASGGTANGQGGYAITGVQPLRGDLEDIAKRGRELGHELLELGVPTGDVEPVLQRIEALTGAQDLPRSASLSEEALRALMELEYNLRKDLDDEPASEPMLSEAAEVPAGYDDMIADYFRRLSPP